MKWLDHATQTVFADLNQRVLDAAFDADYPENGSFSKSTIKGREYWYYTGYDALKGAKIRKYVGPAADAAINARAEAFGRIKVAMRTRLEAVRMLRAAGLPEPDGLTGAIVDKLAKAGFFRLCGVLVGTVAFQTYPGIVGARPEGYLQTGDVDLAQDHGISIGIDDRMEDVLARLREVDATFHEAPTIADRARASTFRNDRGFQVEFLVPNRGSDDHAGRMTAMPALGGAAAQPLRYLDFLIRDPIRSVLLHGGGVGATVPAPERYAVHKLIVATQRRDREKAAKDIGQAGFLIEAMSRFRKLELADAWIEAWQRGPKWREALAHGRALLPADQNALLQQSVTETADAFGVKAGDVGMVG
jgi:hypothetical protein